MASTAHNQGTSAARCKNLVKRYGDVVAVDGLDLEVRHGECFGLLGPNGAGKTTTVEMLEGLTVPDAGEVEILGRSWGNGDDRQLRDELGIQLQDTQLGDKLTVYEIARLFRSFHSRGRDPEEVVDLLGLRAKRNAQYCRLSGGQKQRVALACALVGEPRMLFLDEPTTGLDPQARRHIWEVVEDYCSKGGTALLTTHYMEEAAFLCDRVGIVDQGRIVAIGSPTDLIASLGAGQILEVESEGELDLGHLQQLPGVREASHRLGRYVLSLADIGAALPPLLAYISERQLTLRSLTSHEATLEDVFIRMTGRALRDD
jgi:ABC-2 type transport system ATP-binding protein